MKFELYFAQPKQMIYDNLYNDIFYKELLYNSDDNCKCNHSEVFFDTKPNKEIDEYLLNSIEFRVNNLKQNNKSNQKRIDMITILNIYKNYINSNDNESELNFIKIGVLEKTKDINTRIKNNYTKLFKLYDDYRYYKEHVSSEIKQKGQTRKLNKVKEKMHNYFTIEIELTEKRITFLSNKLSILKYYEKKSDDEKYIKQYIIDFIDKNLNTNGDIHDVLNDVLLYNYGNDGLYYDGLKLPKKCKGKICQNTICEINALIYG